MENQKKCICPLCQKGDYNSEDYYVDMSFLKKERPVGVSGLLRVKNDAEFLSDCIDSCIDALDELIICYQDCTDNAPEIIRKKQQQYPDNVKVVKKAFEDIKDLIQSKFDFEISLKYPRKLCDYRPAFGYILQDYITEYDFWGHVDPDCIWGDLNKYVTWELLCEFVKYAMWRSYFSPISDYASMDEAIEEIIRLDNDDAANFRTCQG